MVVMAGDTEVVVEDMVAEEVLINYVEYSILNIRLKRQRVVRWRHRQIFSDKKSLELNEDQVNK